jgi:MFS family permease
MASAPEPTRIQPSDRTAAATGNPAIGKTADWRSPAVIVLGGCLIAMLAFGPRSALGFFLTPLSATHGWGRDIYALAIAVQSTSIAKVVPESWRSMVFGAGTAAGSFGQFLFSPLGVGLIDAYGWQAALEIFSGLLLLIIPLALMVAKPRFEPTRTAAGSFGGLATQTYKQALAEALQHRSYVLLVLGFFTCGFQLGFVTVHLPSYLIDRGLSAQVGGWTLGLIGLFNIIGAMTSGWLGSRVPKRYILSFIYFSRALAVIGLVTLPASPTVALIYGAVTGLLWLSSVPPTSGLVAVMFGTRWLAMLFGVAFFSHQVGGFLGVYLGGIIYVRTGSYDIVWWLGVMFGVLSGLINLPIIEKPVARLAAIPA